MNSFRLRNAKPEIASQRRGRDSEDVRCSCVFLSYQRLCSAPAITASTGAAIGAHGCGKLAADGFCRRHGIAESASFAQAPRIDTDDPTAVIGNGQICNQRSCNGFATIACRK